MKCGEESACNPKVLVLLKLQARVGDSKGPTEDPISSRVQLSCCPAASPSRPTSAACGWLSMLGLVFTRPLEQSQVPALLLNPGVKLGYSYCL